MTSKKNNVQWSTTMAICSMLLSAASLIWVGGFRFSALIHEVKDLGVRIEKVENRIDKLEIRMDQRFEKIESRLESIQEDLHQHDLRINVLEQRNP